jgi:hypothetical protein
MPTIEVDDSDVVFVVKGRGGLRGGYHELGPNDLVVVMQVLEGEYGYSDGSPRSVGRVWIGGTRLTGFNRFGFTMESGFGPCSVEVTFPEATGWYENLTSRLEPVVTIRYSGDTVEPVQVTEPERYIGVRISRYNRDPVI